MDLNPYEDLPRKLKFQTSEKSVISRAELSELFGNLPTFPQDLQIETENSLRHDDLEVKPVSWWAGYGPRTKGFLVKLAGINKPLPGVIYLHSHDDVKGFGIEKVFDYGEKVDSDVERIRREHYENRPPVNELAKRGFAVLVFDAFLWGSRKFPMSAMPQRLIEVLGRESYEDLAVMHESMVVGKYLSLFNSSLAGLLNFDDQVAIAVAKQLPEISEPKAAVGLSGGGCRAIYLHATNPELAAVVSVGAMATYESMIEKHVAPHSWMFFPRGLAEKTDWPQVAMISETPLYVQYCSNDQLYTLAGMESADQKLKRNAKQTNQVYKSDFYPVKHSFTTQMQDDAFEWLESILLRD